MGKFNRGKVRRTKLSPVGPAKRINNDISKSVQTRVGKQSKFGVKKARTPGQHWNQPKRLGGN
jgi:hypothetical protein